jgi:hypothetical protein
MGHFLPLTLYKPSTSHLCHFRPEDGQRIFLRNVGTELINNLRQNPRQYQRHVTTVKTSNPT